MNDNVFEWTGDSFYPKIIYLMDFPLFEFYHREETPDAVIRKHAFKYNENLKNNCGREGRMRNGFYSDTGFRIAISHVGRATGWEF